MRVATRRLRAVLEIFAPCFPRKRLQPRPARRQGAGRRARRAPRPRRPPRRRSRTSPPASRRPSRPGVERLLAERLRAEQGAANERARRGASPDRRSDLRRRSDAAASASPDDPRGRSSCAAETAREATEGARGQGPRPGRDASPTTPSGSSATRLDELCSFTPRALDPEQVKALHDMRIAAKRLRYVLEVTRALLRPVRGDRAQARQGAPGPARRDPRLRRACSRACAPPPDELRAEDALDGRARAPATRTTSSRRWAPATPHADGLRRPRALADLARGAPRAPVRALPGDAGGTSSARASARGSSTRSASGPIRQPAFTDPTTATSPSSAVASGAQSDG